LLKKSQSVYDVLHYRIYIEVNISEKNISGNTEIRLNMLQSTEEISFDLINSYQVKEIYFNKKAIPFTHSQDLITLISVKDFNPGIHTVKIVYEGTPPVAVKPPWQGGIQWEKDDNNEPWIAFTCQNEGAKILFPCKDHPSDKPDQGAEMEIVVPKGLKVAGPGRLIRERVKDKKAGFVWKTDYPINNYSLVFNIANYHVAERDYTTVEGNVVPMVFYVLQENKHRADKHLDILEKSLRVQEKYFSEFPFIKDKIGIAETPHLGMEHQTMNAYGNKYRYSKVAGEDFDWLLHHELGHEWWGNKVSNSDWAHFWIQEGICTFGDWLYYLEKEGKEAFDRQAKNASLSFINKYPIIADSSADSGKAYHPDIYGKGAFFMRSLSFIVGESAFFDILKSFATNQKYNYENTVTTDDVEQYFSMKSGMTLKSYFDFFLKTTDRLSILVKEVRPNEYDIHLQNYPGSLPLDIQSGKEIKRLIISPEKIRITSERIPVIDPNRYYFKSVTYE
jgi:aminopeptidase N